MTQWQGEQARLEQLIDKYVEEINQSSADRLASLFTDDGVLMAPDAPTMNGPEQIRAFFKQALAAVKLGAKIFFDDIVVAENLAYVRTHSLVNVTLLQTNASHSEENRELFVCRKDKGEWKIARYMFNKLPAAA